MVEQIAMMKESFSGGENSQMVKSAKKIMAWTDPVNLPMPDSDEEDESMKLLKSQMRAAKKFSTLGRIR